MLLNTCEGGTDAIAVTNANSGGVSGDTFATSKGATSTIEYDSAQKAHDLLSHLFTVATSESDYVQWSLTPSGSLSSRFYFRTSTTPTVNSTIAMIRNATAAAMQLALGSDLILRVLNAASANLTTGWTVPLVVNTWYRIEIIVTKGTTTSTGRIQVKIFALDSTTPFSTPYDSGETTNTGTADLAAVRYGRAGASATAHTFWLDDYAAVESASFIGPVGANAAPTVSVAANQYVIAGTATTISWTAADIDGTIASTAITQTAGTAVVLTGTGTSRTFPSTAPQGTYVFGITATDNAAAVSAVAVHTVHVTAITARPAGVVSNPGVYTNEGGAASLQAALADESDTTFIQSPDNPSGAAITLTHPPIGVGAVTVKTRNKASVATPLISRLIELVQDTTVIASATVLLSNVAVDHEFTTTTGQTATITDRSALRVRVTDTLA